ncbi:unnamed protein product, partial [Ixodes pacificus]
GPDKEPGTALFPLEPAEVAPGRGGRRPGRSVGSAERRSFLGPTTQLSSGERGRRSSEGKSGPAEPSSNGSPGKLGH